MKAVAYDCSRGYINACLILNPETAGATCGEGFTKIILKPEMAGWRRLDLGGSMR